MWPRARFRGSLGPPIPLLFLLGAILLVSSPSIPLLLSSGPVSVPPGTSPGVHSWGAALYPVTFNSTGLFPGTAWSVTILGQTWNTTSTTLVVQEPNGSYSYSAHSAQFAAFYINGTFAIRGLPLAILLSWTGAAPPAAGTGSAPAVSSGTVGVPWWLVGTVLVVLVGLIVVVLRVSRRPVVPLPVTPGPTPVPGPRGPPEVEGNEAQDPLSHML